MKTQTQRKTGAGSPMKPQTQRENPAKKKDEEATFEDEEEDDEDLDDLDDEDA